jgi:hypothetical protein
MLEEAIGTHCTTLISIWIVRREEGESTHTETNKSPPSPSLSSSPHQICISLAVEISPLYAAEYVGDVWSVGEEGACKWCASLSLSLSFSLPFFSVYVKATVGTEIQTERALPWV